MATQMPLILTASYDLPTSPKLYELHDCIFGLYTCSPLMCCAQISMVATEAWGQSLTFSIATWTSGVTTQPQHQRGEFHEAVIFTKKNTSWVFFAGRPLTHQRRGMSHTPMHFPTGIKITCAGFDDKEEVAGSAPFVSKTWALLFQALNHIAECLEYIQPVPCYATFTNGTNSCVTKHSMVRHPQVTEWWEHQYCSLWQRCSSGKETELIACWFRHAQVGAEIMWQRPSTFPRAYNWGWWRKHNVYKGISNYNVDITGILRGDQGWNRPW